MDLPEVLALIAAPIYAGLRQEKTLNRLNDDERMDMALNDAKKLLQKTNDTAYK